MKFVVCCCLLFDVNFSFAQNGERYAQQVFENVTVTSGIAYNSATCEGEISPKTLYFDFYEPTADTLQARPLVITVFGGAFIAGRRDFPDMVAYGKRLAQHGYVAASIDYRLIPILALSANSLIREAYIAAQDVSAAIRFFKAHHTDYRIDTNRIFLLGNSAGSIAILHEIFLEENERPNQTLELPLLGSLHSSGFPESHNHSPKVAGAIAQWGGVMQPDVIDAPEYVPLCLIHGTNDNVVPFDSGYCYSSATSFLMPYMYGSNTIATRLSNIGISDFEFHPIQGEEHCFYISSINNLVEDKFNLCFNITRNFLYNHLNFHPSTLDYPENQFKIYPNPASDYISISNNRLNEPYHYEILSSSGQILKTGRLSNQNIDISHLTSGIYYIKIYHNNDCKILKLLKK